MFYEIRRYQAHPGRRDDWVRYMENIVIPRADVELTTRSPDGTWIGGSVDQWVEELTTAVNDYGAGGFVFFLVADTLDDAEKARASWAREIAPAVREATAVSSPRSAGVSRSA
jgi:hypothetical protein